MLPERERVSNQDEEVSPVSENIAVPESLERSGVSSSQASPMASVITDDQGNPLIQPTLQTPTITLPADDAHLNTQAKGNASNASTWRAVYWLRQIKRALKFGWKIITGGN